MEVPYWGNGVNTAAGMEGHGVPGKIQISETTRNLIYDLFGIQERGFVEIKGKGLIKTCLLKGWLANTIA